jgi:D-alanyl-D-alanine carboxypeptidase-like protein
VTVDQEELSKGVGPASSRPPNRTTAPPFVRRRVIAALTVASALVLGVFFLTRGGEDPVVPSHPRDVRGSAAWARAHYGNPDAKKYRERHIIQIEFLGTILFVNEKAAPHFLRLARIFEARAPEYAASIASGTPDDWSYGNRAIRGETTKSNHAFGLAIDINALSNVLGTAGDMPVEVVEEWELEGGAWGGHFSRPDPMHFETHLTPEEIQARYNSDGTLTDDYLEELVGG